MSENDRPQVTFLQALRQELRDLWLQAGDQVSAGRVALRNRIRLARRQRVDYVVIPVGGPLPERAAPPRGFLQRQLPLPPEPMSLEALNHRLGLIADADNVKGVLFVFRGFAAGLATLQNFRAAVSRLRAAGKEAVVFTPYLDLPHYYAATAADRIVVPPSATFEVLGLHSEVIFLKDALRRLGIQADVVQISPYKTALNMLDKTDVTPEQQEQIDWLLDEFFDLVTADIAAARGLSQDEIKAHLDTAPLFAADAHRLGLVDDLAYEDRLPFLLAGGSDPESADPPPDLSETPVPADTPDSEPEDRESVAEDHRREKTKARLLGWAKARDLLLERARRTPREYIGVVALEGAIAMGPSRQPPIDLPIPVPFVGGLVVGEDTIVQSLRRAERDERLAALILYVDSGGGSALASDLIARQIQRIAVKKPVLAYLGGVAASGGYYVSALSRKIMAQPATITGSIGVITAHISTQELYEKLDVRRRTYKRGERALLYSDESPLSPGEREILWASIEDSYRQFKEVVASGRKIPYDDLDPICQGRVWSGRQAQAHNLLDEFGDFIDAARETARLANLPVDDDHHVRVINLHPRDRSYLPPKPFEAAGEFIRHFSAKQLQRHFDRPLFLMPFEIRFRG